MSDGRFSVLPWTGWLRDRDRDALLASLAGAIMRFILSLALGVGLLVIAGIMTLWISTVGGNSPFSSGSYARTSLRDSLLMGVHVGVPDAPKTYVVPVSYSDGYGLSHGDTWPSLTFNLPAGEPVRLLFSLPSHDRIHAPCVTLGPPPSNALEFSPPTSEHVMIGFAPAKVMINDIEFADIQAPAADQPYSLSCRVMPRQTRFTFAEARLRVINIADGQSYFQGYADQPGAQLVHRDPPGPISLKLASLLVEVDMIGGDQATFRGGLAAPGENADSTRELAPGTELIARWTELRRIQSAQILLVIIGALVGIATTLILEGILGLPKKSAPPKPSSDV